MTKSQQKRAREEDQRKNGRVESKQSQEPAAAAIPAVSSAGGRRSTCYSQLRHSRCKETAAVVDSRA
jgi:hypothetical protein